MYRQREWFLYSNMSRMLKRKSECIIKYSLTLTSVRNPDELFDIAEELKTANEERKQAGMMIEQMAQHENVLTYLNNSNTLA